MFRLAFALSAAIRQLRRKLFGAQYHLAAQALRPPIKLQTRVRMASNHALHHARAESPSCRLHNVGAARF
jgi:hypothetical protein